jgi:hypothetical protein
MASAREVVVTEANNRAYTFFGRVLPERVPLRIEIQPAEITAAAFGLRFSAETSIHDSQVVSNIVIKDGEVDLDTLRNLTESSIRTVLDLIGYAYGLSFDLEMLSVTWGGNRRVIFGINVPVLAERRQAAPYVINSDLVKAVGAESSAHFVLEDFREAIRVPRGAGFFCYRSVEAMMQSMKASATENEDAVSWPRLRESLRISRGTLFNLKGHANFPRHGKASSISDSERAKVFETTDEIIRRYLQYLVLGKRKLPTEDYPEL